MQSVFDLIIKFLSSRDKHPISVVTNDTGTKLFDRFQPFWPDEFVSKSGRYFNRLPWWRPFNILLHKWVAAHDGGMHDHPRWSITICLAGEMTERTPWSARRLRPGSIVFRTRKAIHSLDIPEHALGKTWTLFIVGRRNHSQNGYQINPF